MRRHWLARKGRAELTLVFGGWALGPAPFAVLSDGLDVLVVDDYRDLSDDLSEVESYDQIRLLAFSFGVASAAFWLADRTIPLQRCVAVNGTLYPADAECGIAPEIVAATADGLTEASFARFCRRAGLSGSAPVIDIPTAQSELRTIAARGPAPSTDFDRIWISSRDRVIPSAAQETAWTSASHAIRRTDGPHVPFVRGQNWEIWFG